MNDSSLSILINTDTILQYSFLFAKTSSFAGQTMVSREYANDNISKIDIKVLPSDVEATFHFLKSSTWTYDNFA